MIKVSPSILSADFANLSRDVAAVESAGAEYLHIDVMDGVFVPNLSFGPQVVKSIRPYSKMVFDVHLMIVKPWRHIDKFVEAGADSITLHFETITEKLETIDYIKQCGLKTCISIKPKTALEQIEYLLEKLDMVLVMTVEPGYGGQPFIPESLGKIADMSKLIKKHNPSCLLEVDGGINKDNVASVVKAGANVIVAGSAIFKAPDINQAVREIKEGAMLGS